MKRVGWQVTWRHAASGDRFAGEVWENRATAEYLAELLRASGWCFGVAVRRVVIALMGESDSGPMFTFTTSSGTPGASVRCHRCGWTTSGRYGKDVFPRADMHTCPAWAGVPTLVLSALADEAGFDPADCC